MQIMRNIKNEYKILLIIILLAVIAVFIAAVSAVYLKDSSDKLLAVCDIISEGISGDNLSIIAQGVSQLTFDWSSIKDIWFMLLDHADVHKVEEFITEVNFYTEHRLFAEAERHIRLLKIILEDIGMADSVSFLTVI